MNIEILALSVCYLKTVKFKNNYIFHFYLSNLHKFYRNRIIHIFNYINDLTNRLTELFHVNLKKRIFSPPLPVISKSKRNQILEPDLFSLPNQK